MGISIRDCRVYLINLPINVVKKVWDGQTSFRGFLRKQNKLRPKIIYQHQWFYNPYLWHKLQWCMRKKPIWDNNCIQSPVNRFFFFAQFGQMPTMFAFPIYKLRNIFSIFGYIIHEFSPLSGLYAVWFCKANDSSSCHGLTSTICLFLFK